MSLFGPRTAMSWAERLEIGGDLSRAHLCKCLFEIWPNLKQIFVQVFSSSAMTRWYVTQYSVFKNLTSIQVVRSIAFLLA